MTTFISIFFAKTGRLSSCGEFPNSDIRIFFIRPDFFFKIWIRDAGATTFT